MGIALRTERRLPVLLAAVGLFVSLYLQVLHVRAWLDPAAGGFCAVNQTLDCVAVALSPWSVLFGVPVAAWGCLGFWTLLVAAFTGSRWLLPLSAVAAIGSLALLGVELASIGSVCMFCEAAHITSWLLFAVAYRGRAAWRSSSYRDSELLVTAVLPCAGIVLATWLFVPSYWKIVTWKGEVPLAHGITPDGHPWIGAEQPELTVEEWIDYGCPHCKSSSAWTLRSVAKHSDKLRLVRRQNPRMQCTAGSPYACIFARAAICAQKQGRAWQMDRWLFANNHGNSLFEVAKAAEEVGVSQRELEACMQANETHEAANADAKAARKARLLSTPGYRLNGTKIEQAKLFDRLRVLD